MLYQPHRFSEKTPPLINLQMLVALGGGLLAAAQALLIVAKGNILCLNDGCEVVEQLTTVPPIAFNVAGSIFFMSVFLALWQGARGVRGWLNLARMLLLAGMAAEGVLVGFQYYVAQVFCSYCLTIFALIFLLNMLMGWRQLLGGIAVHGAVLVAFSSLQFVPHNAAPEMDIAKGVYGRLAGKTDDDVTRSLFFSSSCPHCEEVIATIDADFLCSLEFNPIDELARSPLPALPVPGDYFPEVNRAMLKKFDINEIPVLMVRTSTEMRIVQGSKAISGYFTDNCRERNLTVLPESGESGISGMTPAPALQFLQPSPGAETCAVDTDCEEDGAAVLQ